MSDNLVDVDFILTEAKIYKNTLASFYNDPYAFRSMSFALQQLVEKTIKVYLSFSGVTIPKSHEIGKLLRMCVNHSVPLKVNDWLMSYSGSLTEWANNGRYETEFYLSLKEIQTATDNVFLFLKDNGIMPELMPEITPTVLFELSGKCGRDLNECSNAMKNVLYCVYMRKSVTMPAHPKTLDEYFDFYHITDKTTEIQRLQSLYHTNDMSEVLDYVYRDFM